MIRKHFFYSLNDLIKLGISFNLAEIYLHSAYKADFLKDIYPSLSVQIDF